MKHTNCVAVLYEINYVVYPIDMLLYSKKIVETQKAEKKQIKGIIKRNIER